MQWLWPVVLAGSKGRKHYRLRKLHLVWWLKSFFVDFFVWYVGCRTFIVDDRSIWKWGFLIVVVVVVEVRLWWLVCVYLCRCEIYIFMADGLSSIVTCFFTSKCWWVHSGSPRLCLGGRSLIFTEASELSFTLYTQGDVFLRDRKVVDNSQNRKCSCTYIESDSMVVWVYGK
jgi:hypothetical protein